MAALKDIKGITVEVLSSDPYTSTISAGAWASGGNMPAAKYGMGSSGAGTQDATMYFGGAPDNDQTCTYNGTAWTEVNNLNTGRGELSGTGITTAALAVGSGTNVEQWDGSNWTAKTGINTGRAQLVTVGSTTSAVAFGGETSPVTADSETWNGSTWTEGNNLNTARRNLGGGGITTAALAYGGLTPTASSAVETYDGTSWTTNPATLNTAREAMANYIGTQTLALCAGGDEPPVTSVEYWDGSSWTEVADLAGGRRAFGGAGSTTSGIVYGGYPPSVPPHSAATEEWTTASPLSVAQEGQVWYNSSSKVLKGFGLSAGAGTWASSPSLNTGRAYPGSAGNAPNSAMVFGGETPSATGATETYDGSAWTTVPATLNSPRTYIMSFGITTASMAAGGTPPQTANAETWNGTSWAEGNNLNSARHSGGGSGITTAGLVFSGGTWNQPSLHKLTESYDGSCWTEVADLNNDHMTNINSLGLTQTAAICSSGYKFPSPAATAFTEEWDGSSWTEIADLNTARYYAGGSGSVTSGLIMGGEVPAPTYYAKVEHFNGTAWTEIADMGTARTHFPGTTTNGPATGVVISGGGPGFQTSSETYSAGEAIKTFTAS